MPEPPKQPLPPTLEGWLRIATRGLCEAAVKRIQSEVSSHYREAVEAYRAQGLVEKEAQERALECLGNSRTAGEGFRRTHLAKWQQVFLLNLTDIPEGLVIWALNVFIMISFVDAGAWALSLKSDWGKGLALGALHCICAPYLVVQTKAVATMWGQILRGRKPNPAAAIGAVFVRSPRATGLLTVLLCVPYGLGAARFHQNWSDWLTWFVLLPVMVWLPGLMCAWKLLFEQTWRREWIRDILATALGVGLLWGAIELSTHSMHMYEMEETHAFDIRLAMSRDGLLLGSAWPLVLALILVCASAATFLGAWLARKRGTEPSQATPEPVRDDAA